MQELIRADDLTKIYYTTGQIALCRRKTMTAVDNISFSISSGESFGLVGESGCGKSTVGKLLLNMIKPTAGKVYYRGNDLQQVSKANLKSFRSKLQPIFQDADSSLDPRYTVYDIMAEPFKIQKVNHEKMKSEILELLNVVNIGDELLRRYPHELSGGQRQRIGIARAIAMNPEVIVADEPAASLDLSVQAQVLDLLNSLREKHELGLLYISHNLHMVRLMTNRMAVMYLGSFVESGDTKEIFERPLHPYTKMLLSSMLVFDPLKRRKNRSIIGELPDPSHMPSGCRFHPRCTYCKQICTLETPMLKKVGDSREVACHFI